MANFTFPSGWGFEFEIPDDCIDAAIIIRQHSPNGEKTEIFLNEAECRALQVQLGSFIGGLDGKA